MAHFSDEFNVDRGFPNLDFARLSAVAIMSESLALINGFSDMSYSICKSLLCPRYEMKILPEFMKAFSVISCLMNDSFLINPFSSMIYGHPERSILVLSNTLFLLPLSPLTIRPEGDDE